MKAREKIILEGEPKDGDGNEFLNVCLPGLLFIYIFSPFIDLICPAKNTETSDREERKIRRWGEDRHGRS